VKAVSRLHNLNKSGGTPRIKQYLTHTNSLRQLKVHLSIYIDTPKTKYVPEPYDINQRL
jgi:hypothetical protein